MRSSHLRRLLFPWILVGASLPMVASDHHFIGIYSKPDAGRKFPATFDQIMEEKELPAKERYDAERREFLEKHKAHSPATYLLEPTRASVVYEIDTLMEGFGVIRKSVGVVHGKDLEQARELLEKKFTPRERRYVSAPRIIFRWPGDGGFVRVVTHTYPGIEIKFTARETPAGKTTVMAQGRNLSATQSAEISLPPGANPTGGTITLAPGGTFNRLVGSVESFDLEVRFLEPPKTARGIVETIREVVREHVMLKDGKVKATRVLGGIRG